VLRAYDPEQNYGIYALDDAKCGAIDPKRLAKERIVANENENASKCANLAARAARRKDVCYATYPKYVQDLDYDGKIAKLTKKQTLDGILHIWHALAFLHEHNVIHGDIKGPNMAIAMRKGKPTFVFADWGWSGQTSTLEEAKDALESMQDVASEYIAHYYNHQSYGIWSPKLLTETPTTLAGMRELLEFNDVFCLAYDLMSFVKRYEEHGLINANVAAKLQRIFENIFYTQPLKVTARQVAEEVKKAIESAPAPYVDIEKEIEMVPMKRKLRGGSSKCRRSSRRKYTERNSPPFPANKCCYLKRRGNDTLMYNSVPSKTGCRWQRSK
jgi:hypothetical protein